MQIKQLRNLGYTMAQLTPHQVLVEPAYQPYLNKLYIIIYASEIFYFGIKLYINNLRVYVSKIFFYL